MTEKMLGKIDFAEFGTIKDYPFMIGLQLGFRMGGYAVADGGKYTVNINQSCKWTSDERAEAIVSEMETVYDILSAAKVNYISELIGKPVEITLDGNAFRDFRILTEVL